ncbi:adenylyl cyclase X E-like [Glossina fuscipes fuscipes]
MIPAQIAKTLTREIEERIEKTFEGTKENGDEKLGRKIFIESHTDVTIIFADIVNYTFLTTRVDVKTLVETLHELFQKFDQACKEYNIMPIKFLGDCYYAVSGIPTSHPLHSVCCIEFGLSIITHIRNVRASKQLDIDMRIGVHSGSLLGGIIGAAKWQYDIWSIDVDIANRLEATGMPGRVHVSNNALRLAQNFYEYENGTEKAKLDPVLIKNKVKTFLIIDKNESMQKSLEWRNYRRMNEEARRRETGDSGLVSYQDIISDANKSMETEVDKLPICKFQFATVVPDASITMDLGLMNDIVCHFDEILSMYKSPLKVEKIKIVNGTYMAACGLSAESTGRSFLGSLLLTSRKGLIDIRSNRFLRRIANVDIYDFGTQRRDTARSEHSDDTDSGASWVSEQSEAEPDNKMQTVVYRMASFALDLLKTVQTLNARLKEQRGLTNPPLSLRVGISSGEVAAGIVGYTTSHYDIWGNAVNMASRMDTTGVPDRIQVCEETANILGTYDILCSYRGMTYIKSLGELPTYFIEIDESFNFAYK